MVDNSENILVEFDYNNIFLVDPNKVIDNNGKAQDRLIKHENLVIYANLECKVLPRTKLALGVASNDAVQNITVASINFLNPGKKTYLDNSYTDELTGKDTLQGRGVNQPKLEKVGFTNEKKEPDYFIRQQTLSSGRLGSVDNGLLGITSISIRQNTSMEPQVTIQMEDVKGRALFESGDNSPYAPFFNLPYPLFYLTIKGYFGKAIRLPLMLHKFNARYDTSNGNFKIQLDFFTYKFSLLSEVAVGSLQAVPHMYTSKFNVTKINNTLSPTDTKTPETITRGYQKIKEVYSDYISKGLLPDNFPQLTLVQLQNNLKLFLKNELGEFTKQNLKPITDADTYLDVLNQYRGEIKNYETSWFNTYCDRQQNFFIIQRGNELIPIFTLKEGYRTDPNNKKEAQSKLLEIVNRYNNLLSENETFGKNKTYTIGNKPPVKSEINNRIQFDSFQKGGTFVFNTPIDFGTQAGEGNVRLDETWRLKKSVAQPTVPDYQTLRKELINSDIAKNTDDYPFFYFSGTGSFNECIDQMEKDLNTLINQIEEEITTELSFFLQNKTSTLGFKPTIRNVLGVIFANGEAFMRLLDDTHSKAWDARDNKDKKAVIFDPAVSSASPDIPQLGQTLNQPVYPWPQFIVQTGGQNGKEKYEIKYPADSDVIGRTKANNPNVWPEVEFVEEYIRGFTKRLAAPNFGVTTNNELKDVLRLSFNAIEFPIENNVYFNKEEVKFYYEIYERILWISNYSKLSRSYNFTSALDKITTVIADSEVTNIKNSLGKDNPFLSDKLKNYAVNLTNLKQFSNGGFGESWQNFIRGIFNTSYIKNKTENAQIEFFLPNFLNNSVTTPKADITSIEKLQTYISDNSETNVFDFTDTYPFTNKQWITQYLSNGVEFTNPILAFDTRKSVFYNDLKKTITNFEKNGENRNFNRPFSNFSYLNKTPTNFLSQGLTPPLKTFYENRQSNQTFITEGRVEYSNYNDGLVSAKQTTSILNTPYFINSIQRGIQNFRDNETYPFVASAYLFLNSLPLSTLRETYKTLGDSSNPEDLSYIFATFKKFGGVHKLPFAWILKMGSIWHRYKTFINDGRDIIETSWSGFSYLNNYDPVTNDSEKEYNLIINNSQIDIILQKNSVFGSGPNPETSTLINVGFYPKLINDFSVFYLGYPIIATDYQINGVCDVQGTTLTIINIQGSLQVGDILSGLGIPAGTTILSQINSSQFQLNNSFNITNSTFIVTNRRADGYTSLDIQSAITSGLTFNYVNTAIVNLPEGFDSSNSKRDCRIIPWSMTVRTNDGNFEYPLPSHGSLFNQTKNECIKNGKKQIEVLNNQAMYDGSVRLFWGAPNFGYYDNAKVSKPSPYEYLNFINNNTNNQENFSIRNSYTQISEIFSVFEKSVLDNFENEFLKFSKSIYDYADSSLFETSNKLAVSNQVGDVEASYRNFQYLMRKMMVLTVTTGDTGDKMVELLQEKQLTEFNNYIQGFLNYDIIFKFGNPSSYDKKLFYSFSNLQIIDGFEFDRYTLQTPNTLPTQGGNITLSASRSDPRNTLAWKALLTYVGFSEIPELQYKDNGSYITDFFVDLNIAFTQRNVELFAPMIKIYATQKLNQFQTNPIPKPAPPVGPIGNLVSVATLRDNFTINIYVSGPSKWGVYKTPTGEVSFEGTKSFQTNYQIIIDEIILIIYGSLATNPNQNQYIVNIQQAQNTEQENYPQVPNPSTGISKGIFFESMTNYLLKIEDFIGKILDNINGKLTNELESITNITLEKLDSEIRDAPKTKIELYDMFKAFNDKWIAGGDFKNRTLFEDILILDRASRNIGDIILIDLFKLSELLDFISPENTMEGLIKTILHDNRFVYMNLPSYVNFYGVQDAVKNPKPKTEGSLEFANSLFGTFTNVDYTESRSKLVCFFPGKPSEQLAINNIDWRYRNDAFDLRRTDNPLVEEQTGKKDFDKSNRVVGFNVDIGIQNQSIFKSFTVGQENGLSTAESLQILNDMANQSGGRQGTTQSVSLYNLYKNRSYTCSISMMGNALIQPTMYFNLRYVPMFYGAYYITEVNHSISQGEFSTDIVGVRQATAALSKIDDYLQNLKYNFVRNIIDQRRNEIKQQKAEIQRGARLEEQAIKYITEGIKPLSTLSNRELQVGAPYEDFRQVSPDKITITLKFLKETLKQKTANENIRLCVFSWFYFSSIYNQSLEARGYNFGNIVLTQSARWSDPLITKYFPKKEYYCSSDQNPLFLVVFPSLDKVVDFFIERWTPLINQLKGTTPTNVFEFTFINSNVDISLGKREWESIKNQTDTFDAQLLIIGKAIQAFNAI